MFGDQPADELDVGRGDDPPSMPELFFHARHNSKTECGTQVLSAILLGCRAHLRPWLCRLNALSIAGALKIKKIGKRG
jgi:hypothetical protein